MPCNIYRILHTRNNIGRSKGTGFEIHSRDGPPNGNVPRKASNPLDRSLCRYWGKHIIRKNLSNVATQFKSSFLYAKTRLLITLSIWYILSGATECTRHETKVDDKTHRANEAVCSLKCYMRGSTMREQISISCVFFESYNPKILTTKLLPHLTSHILCY